MYLLRSLITLCIFIFHSSNAKSYLYDSFNAYERSYRRIIIIIIISCIVIIIITINPLIIIISPSYMITSINTGSTSTIEIELNNHIGELQQINIQNNGYDGWIFIDFTCQIKQIIYQLEIKKPYQWLQNYNKNLELLYENGFNANSNQDDYLANDNMILNVISHVFIYSSIGVIDDYTLH